MAQRPGFTRSPAPSPEPSSESSSAGLRSQRSLAPSPDPSPAGPSSRSSRSQNRVRFTPDTMTSPSRSPRPPATRSRHGASPSARSSSSETIVPLRHPTTIRSARPRSTTSPARSRSTRSTSATRVNSSTPDDIQAPDQADDPYINLETDSSSGEAPPPGNRGGERSAGSATPPDLAEIPGDLLRCSWLVPWPGPGATQCRTTNRPPGIPPLNRVERILPCEMHNRSLCHSHRAIQNNVCLPKRNASPSVVSNLT